MLLQPVFIQGSQSLHLHSKKENTAQPVDGYERCASPVIILADRTNDGKGWGHADRTEDGKGWGHADRMGRGKQLTMRKKARGWKVQMRRSKAEAG
jgi:hypothetical protein